MAAILYPLASLEQIESTPSRKDGIPEALEEDLRAFGCRLIQQAGVLLKLDQVAMATAQVLFHRFWYVSSLKQFGIGDMGMGALYLASKLEECPIRIRDLINVYDLLLSRTRFRLSSPSSFPASADFKYEPMGYFDARFYDLKDALVVAEMQILKRLGFTVQVQLPYGTLINYLQVLGLTGEEEVPQKTWSYMNDSLQTPVYAVYPFPSIAAACIFLTCRQLEIPLPEDPEGPWWELFDVTLDDIMSICGYIQRLYRPRDTEDTELVMRLVNKTEVRRWLEEQA